MKWHDNGLHCSCLCLPRWTRGGHAMRGTWRDWSARHSIHGVPGWVYRPKWCIISSRFLLPAFMDRRIVRHVFRRAHAPMDEVFIQDYSSHAPNEAQVSTSGMFHNFTRGMHCVWTKFYTCRTVSGIHVLNFCRQFDGDRIANVGDEVVVHDFLKVSFL